MNLLESFTDAFNSPFSAMNIICFQHAQNYKN